MSVLLCFVLFAAVYGTAAIESFDHYQMELFFKQLVTTSIISKDPFLKARYNPCPENENVSEGFFNCYKHMKKQYAAGQEAGIVEIVMKHIIEKVKVYNHKVWSYSNAMKTDSNSLADVELKTIQIISFKDSKLHCVAEFFRQFKTEMYASLLLNDYFYYYQFDTVPNLQKKEVFFEHIMIKFKHSKTDTIKPVVDFEGEMKTAKNDINNFSDPFCKIQYINNEENKYVDKWLWKALQNSSVLPEIIIDEQSIYDYKGLQANTTLRGVFNGMHTVTGYHQAVNYYATVQNIVNMYLVKVLTRKLLYIVTNAMQLYYTDVSTLDLNNEQDKIKFEDRKSTQLYVLQNFFAFNSSVGMFSNASPGTNNEDINFLVTTMNVIYEQFSEHTFSPTAMDPKSKIDLINKQLEYKGLPLIPDTDQKAIDHYSGNNDETVNLDDLIELIERINYSLSYIVEVLRD